MSCTIGSSQTHDCQHRETGPKCAKSLGRDVFHIQANFARQFKGPFPKRHLQVSNPGAPADQCARFWPSPVSNANARLFCGLARHQPVSPGDDLDLFAAVLNISGANLWPRFVDIQSLMR
jgi:hypothetical protein